MFPQIFTYHNFQIRTVIIENEPWFVAKDVCDVLEVSNPTVAVQRLDFDEVAKFNLGGQFGETNIINESGLYSLILGSRKQEAREFKRWVTHEVIPSIRKNGSYGVNQLPQNYKEALIALIEQVDKTEKLEKVIIEQSPKVALYDTAMSAKNNLPMNAVAKTLNIGRNKLFAFLRDQKVLMINNLPYQRYVDTGYFEVRQYTITHFTSGLENKVQTMVTPKGMAYIHNLLTERSESHG